MTEIGDRDAERRVLLPGRPDVTLRLSWAAATDTGRRRQQNEDSFIAQPPVFAVADGMGGHAAGDIASGAVVSRLGEISRSDFTEPDSIDASLRAATDDIERLAGDLPMGVGTTVTGAALTVHAGEPYFAIFNIGDSRTYLYDQGDLTRVTVDHSVVQELVDAGLISEQEAEHHPDSNVITRAVGFNAEPQPDYWMLPIRPSLRLLVCSDGLTKEVSDDRIARYLASGLDAVDTAHALIDAALAAGGRDNVTAVIVDVIEYAGEAELDDTIPRGRGASGA